MESCPSWTVSGPSGPVVFGLPGLAAAEVVGQSFVVLYDLAIVRLDVQALIILLLTE